MIVDTSAVIELLRATQSPTDLRLRRALIRAEPVCIPAVVLQEVLQGARSPSDFIRLQAEMETFPLFEPEDVAELAQDVDADATPVVPWSGWPLVQRRIRLLQADAAKIIVHSEAIVRDIV